MAEIAPQTTAELWWESRRDSTQDRFRAYGIKPMKGTLIDMSIWNDGLEDGYWIATRGTGLRNAVLYRNTT